MVGGGLGYSALWVTGEDVQMDKLETALDDLDGLFEACRALCDDARSGVLRRSPDGLRQLQREIAAAADAYVNKVLVELREATLLYMASARNSDDGNGAKTRAAVGALLAKTEGHAAELAKLAPDVGGQSESLGAVLATDVAELLHRTALQWEDGGTQIAG